MANELNLGLTLYRSQFYRMGLEIECPECGGEGVGYALRSGLTTTRMCGFLSERMGECSLRVMAVGYVAAQ